MNPAERLIASRLMEMAADIFSNHGCNDLDPSVLAGIAEADKADIEIRWNHWNSNGDKNEWVKLDHIGDSSLMSYVAALLADPSENKEAL